MLKQNVHVEINEEFRYCGAFGFWEFAPTVFMTP